MATSTNTSVKVQTKVSDRNSVVNIHAFADRTENGRTRPAIFKADIISISDDIHVDSGIITCPEENYGRYIRGSSTNVALWGTSTTSIYQIHSDFIPVKIGDEVTWEGRISTNNVLGLGGYREASFSRDAFVTRLVYTDDAPITGKFTVIIPEGVNYIAFGGYLGPGGHPVPNARIVSTYNQINNVKGKDGELILSYDGTDPGRLSGGELIIEPEPTEIDFASYYALEDLDLVYEGPNALPVKGRIEELTGLFPREGFTESEGSWKSAIGNNWELLLGQQSTDIPFQGAASNGRGTIVIVGSDFTASGVRYQCKVSTDNGQNWINLRLPDANNTQPTPYYSVRWLNGQFVAVGANAYIAYSADGLTWTGQRVTYGTLNSPGFRDIIYTNGRYWLVGRSNYLTTPYFPIVWILNDITQTAPSLTLSVTTTYNDFAIEKDGITTDGIYVVVVDGRGHIQRFSATAANPSATRINLAQLRDIVGDTYGSLQYAFKFVLFDEEGALRAINRRGDVWTCPNVGTATTTNSSFIITQPPALSYDNTYIHTFAFYNGLYYIPLYQQYLTTSDWENFEKVDIPTGYASLEGRWALVSQGQIIFGFPRLVSRYTQVTSDNITGGYLVGFSGNYQMFNFQSDQVPSLEFVLAKESDIVALPLYMEFEYTSTIPLNIDPETALDFGGPLPAIGSARVLTATMDRADGSQSFSLVGESSGVADTIRLRTDWVGAASYSITITSANGTVILSGTVSSTREFETGLIIEEEEYEAYAAEGPVTLTVTAGDWSYTGAMTLPSWSDAVIDGIDVGSLTLTK